MLWHNYINERSARSLAKKNNNSSILQVLQLGDARELKMMALRTLLEFGSNEDKCRATRELHQIAFVSDLIMGASDPAPLADIEINVSSDDDSTTL